MRRRALLGLCLGALCAAFAAPADAEPYLAVMQGNKCDVCHVNPTGGGLRNQYGMTFSKLVLPAQTLDAELAQWDGEITRNLRAGGDLRADWSDTQVPNARSQQQFQLEQFRLYSDLTLITGRLGVYVDEYVAPNSPQNEEAYLHYGNPLEGFFIKAGQFYLPFGWRLQDQTAFVREATGISMTTPQQGVEVDYEHASWSAQLDYTNVPSTATSVPGHQVTGQVVYVKPWWRLGAATSLTHDDAGNRQVYGLFAGLRTGPVAWLGEADLIHDDSFPGGRTLAAGLFEADWRVRKGHNLKLTLDYYDPNRSVSENQQVRYSFVYEYTPIPFVQLRAGYRRYRGIPQNDNENRRLTFVELHGYF